MIDSIRNLGLRNRVFLTILGIILLVGSLLYFKVQYDQRQALHNSYLSIAQNALDNRSQHLIIRIENLRNQTRFLSQTPPVQAIARAIKNNGFDQLEGNSRSIWEQRLKDIFKAFLQANPFYFQLRYIGVADNGKELIRVDYKNDQIITATGEQLQSKGDEKYFIETLKMSEGEIYISDVTLNREFGVVQLPHVRTIRASVPVFTPDGELFGMVVANMDIGPVFDLVMSQIRPGIKGYVSNQEGDFLVHPYPEKTFGFDLGKRYRWQDEMPSTDLHNLSQKKDKLVSTHSHLEQEDLLHAVAGKVYFDKDRPDRYMLLIYSFPESLIENETVAFRNLMLLGFFVLTFLLGIIMYVMLKKIFSPLTQLTNGASAIAEGRHDIEFPKGTSDEVGYLVSAFQYMLKGITSQEQKVATLYEELKRSEVYANHIIESTPQGIIVADTNGQIVRVNKIVLLMFGYDEDEIHGQSVELLMPEKFIPDHRINYVNYLNRKDSKPRIMGENHNLTARCKDGSEIAVEIGISPMRLDDKRYVVATIADITERSAIEQELQIAATAFDSHEAMLVTDSQGDILRVNDAFTKVTGYSREEVIGKNPNILQSGRHSADFYHDMWERINQDGCWQGEIWDRRKNGEVYPKWATITSVSDKNGQVSNYVSIFSDISSVKKAQDQILELAYYDPLTGLPNRRRLVEYLERAMVESKRSNMFGALMFIDLDNFKIINDTLGHEQGDVLLKEVANRLTTALREVDIVARLGGDEFVVILHELESDGNRAMQYARHIGENLIRILAKPHILEGRSYVCTGSLGITMYYGNEVSFDEIFRSSDVAMYEAKKRGRNSLRFFDPEMQASLEKRSQMESDLRIALKKKQFVLYFQKQVDNEGRIIGMEALVRWAHPERGMISPSEFIPVCEDSGLIVPVGHWILTESCRTLSQWQQHDSMKHLKLAVNISIKEFMQDDFVSQVNLLVDEYGVHSDRLELEITESMAHDDLDALIEKMHQLKKTGISIAMDDFGTGYSSLSYLKKLPVDIIKIDRSFVDDLGVNANNESIVKTIAKVGESFGMDVLAEGVETEEQFRLLIEYGYKQFQGYYFGKPMTADKFEEEFQSIPRREK